MLARRSNSRSVVAAPRVKGHNFDSSSCRRSPIHERRACGKVVLTVVVGEDELAEISGSPACRSALPPLREEAGITAWVAAWVYSIDGLSARMSTHTPNAPVIQNGSTSAPKSPVIQNGSGNVGVTIKPARLFFLPDARTRVARRSGRHNRTPRGPTPIRRSCPPSWPSGGRRGLRRDGAARR